MDELRIKSNFLKGIIGHLISKFIKEKTETNIGVIIDDLEIESDGDGYRIKLKIEGTVPKEDVLKLLPFK